jgi:hypothetical protein
MQMHPARQKVQQQQRRRALALLAWTVKLMLTLLLAWA